MVEKSPLFFLEKLDVQKRQYADGVYEKKNNKPDFLVIPPCFPKRYPFPEDFPDYNYGKY
jgi:hypothetical protein